MVACGFVNEYFAARRAMIDDHLSKVAARTGAPKPLASALRTALTSAGKRVRGVLVLAVGEAAGGAPEKLLDAAVAMEMIHTSSLVLDDLPSMDDGEKRRGAPTLHRQYGEDLAILSAVALLNHSYGLVAKNHAALSPRQWPLPQVIRRIVDAVGWDGTIGGQAVDLHNEESKLDFDTLEFIHSRKTGALFVAAAAVGGMLANMSPAALQRIEQTIATIRTVLHVQREDFDRNAASDLAASIENLTEQLDLATKQWLANDPQSFTTACRQETAILVRHAATIHNDLVRGVPVAQLQSEIDQAYEHWRTAYKYLVKCQTDDRPVLGRLSGRLTPALVELRTMISQSTTEQTALRPVRR